MWHSNVRWTVCHQWAPACPRLKSGNITSPNLSLIYPNTWRTLLGNFFVCENIILVSFMYSSVLFVEEHFLKLTASTSIVGFLLDRSVLFLNEPRQLWLEQLPMDVWSTKGAGLLCPEVGQKTDESLREYGTSIQGWNIGKDRRKNHPKYPPLGFQGLPRCFGVKGPFSFQTCHCFEVFEVLDDDVPALAESMMSNYRRHGYCWMADGLGIFLLTSSHLYQWYWCWKIAKIYFTLINLQFSIPLPPKEKHHPPKSENAPNSYHLAPTGLGLGEGL